MSSTDQRAQWAEHLRDEALTQRSQQDAAGAAHAPLERPLPHSADDLEAAVAAERARCAELVQQWAGDGMLQHVLPNGSDAERRAAAQALRALHLALVAAPR